MTDAEKEYRAQWIRDAARDFMIAHLSVGAETRPTMYVSSGLPDGAMFMDSGAVVRVPEGSPLPTAVESPLPRHCLTLASSLWDLYVKERE